MLIASAFRNLIRSTKRSVVLIVLQSAIILMFFLGNSVLLQSNVGLKEGYIDNFTGDAMVKAKTEVPVSIFGAVTPSIGEFYAIPEIVDHDAVKEKILTDPEVSAAVSVVSGLAELRLGDYREGVPLFGVDAAEYFDFFPGLRVVRGTVLEPGVPGVMITEARAAQMAERTGGRPEIGTPILFSTYGDGGFKIREAPLTGIFRYESSGAALDQVVLIDAPTLRQLNRATEAVDESYVPVAEATSLMDGDWDGLFGDTFDDSDDSDASGGLSLDGFFETMGRERSTKTLEIKGGAWHFILLRFAEGTKAGRTVRRLNGEWSASGLEVVDWRDAAGLSALLVLLLRVVFNGGFILVVTAGVIAVVNILVISVIERTGEIGTLRAIGATRGYVRRLLVAENLTVSGLSGILAVASGTAALAVLRNARIGLSNSLLRSLFGSTVLTVSFSSSVALQSLVLTLALGLIASIFPTVMALRVTPVRAIAQE